MRNFKSIPSRIKNHTDFFGSKKNNYDQLSSDEINRLDLLLSSSKWFHYAAFTLAGLSFVLSFIEQKSGFTLPIGDIAVPPIEATVFLYYLVLIFSIISDRYFELSKKWIEIDQRRIPFAWISFNAARPKTSFVRFWLMLPMIICAFATGNSFTGNVIEGYSLSYFSLIFWFLSRMTFNAYEKIQSRNDHRGGKVTYSMWLLYWFYLYRQLIITIFFATPLIVLLPNIEIEIIDLITYMVIAILPFQVIRLICSAPKVYRYLDKKGASIGFPEKSIHYK